jgi:hypothetical protein
MEQRVTFRHVQDSASASCEVAGATAALRAAARFHAAAALRGAATLRAAAAAAVLLAVGGCGLIFDPSDVGRGAQQLSGDYAGLPAWSADSRSVYYTQAGTLLPEPTTFSVIAADAATGRRRTLVSIPGVGMGGEQIRASADPAALFISLFSGGLRSTIHRLHLATGAVDIVAADATREFVLSGSGNRIAYWAWTAGIDSIYVRNVSGSNVAHVASLRPEGASVTPLALSPDGATLVYSQAWQLFATPVHGGAPTNIDPAGVATSREVRWDGSTPHLLSAGWTGTALTLYHTDGGTGARRQVGVIPEAIAAVGPYDIAASPDGSTWAAWVPVRQVGQFMEVPVYRRALFVQGPGDSAPRRLLEWEADGATWLAFSPDGRRVGMRVHTRVYSVEVR